MGNLRENKYELFDGTNDMLETLTAYKAPTVEDSHNTDGSKTNYYDIPSWVVDLDDIAEYLDLRGDEFNCLKALFGIAIARKTNSTRHQGTSSSRDAKKLVHYASRIEKRISNV